MAGAAIEAAGIVGGCDAGGSGLHGKADIHMANSAIEFGAMDPMFEDYGSEIRLVGIIVDDYAAVFVRKRPFLADARLRLGLTVGNQKHG
jgi:hypothetical protein